MILTDVVSEKTPSEFKIMDSKFDDCFVLTSNKVFFETPDYKIKIESGATENYLQVYTPPNRGYLAIEPCTAPADSFNNEVGLQVLKSDEEYHIQWKIEELSNL